jgi:diguanylate cyclase (GGDEF)-like protein/PAS domain S-box-containing protein
MIRKKESYLRALIDNFPFMVWLKDKESCFLAVNQVHAHSHGFLSPDDITGKTDFDLSPLDLAKHYREIDLSIMQSGQKQVIEEHYEGPEGRRWIETYKAPVISHNGEMLGTVGFSRDITERKIVETELRITAAIFNAQVGMVVTDNECVILKVNEAFTMVTGYNPEEAIGKHMSFLSSGIHQPAFYKSMWENIALNDGWQGEIWNHRSDGEIYPQWLTITAIKGLNDHVTNYVGTMMDISDRKVIEEKMQHLAHYDALTNLPNRALLMDRLHFGIAQARRNKSLFCLMYLDLDKFKEVNDTLGHSIGDLLLKEVSQRLLNNIKRETDTVARMGGDEFIILLSKIQNHDDVIQIATSILSDLDSLFFLMGNQVHISASIGIAFYPTHAEDPEALIKVADAALYEAKRNGKNCYKFASF